MSLKLAPVSLHSASPAAGLGSHWVEPIRGMSDLTEFPEKEQG